MTTNRITTLLLAVISLAHIASGDLSLPESILEEEAVFIGAIVRRDAQQTLIPAVGFRCSGNLSKWTVVGSRVGGGLNPPELQIWRPTGQRLGYTKVSGTRVHPTSQPLSANIYEVELTSSFSFLDGDILGIHTPPAPSIAIKFQKRGGPLNYWSTAGVHPGSIYSLNAAGVFTNRIDAPLVAVEATPSHCVTGFLQQTALQLKASLLTVNNSDLQYREATQRIIPEARFPENGFVDSLKVGALRRSGTRYPEIQIWRPSGGDVWNKVATIDSKAAIATTPSLNVHEYRPFSPVPVLAGDIVGIYQPYTSASALQIFFQDRGPLNYSQPAVANPKNTLSTRNILVNSENRQPLLAIEFRIERASTLTTMMLACCRTTRTTMSPWLRPSTTPDPMTDQRHHSNHLILIGVAIIVLVLSATVLAIVIVVLRYKGLGTHTVNHRMSANARDKCSDFEGSMQYNVNYRPGDPRHIITNGKKQEVDLRINKAYGGAQDKDHVYESIN